MMELPRHAWPKWIGKSPHSRPGAKRARRGTTIDDHDTGVIHPEATEPHPASHAARRTRPSPAPRSRTCLSFTRMRRRIFTRPSARIEPLTPAPVAPSAPLVACLKRRYSALTSFATARCCRANPELRWLPEAMQAYRRVCIERRGAPAACVSAKLARELDVS